ncbi:MAG TPA: membrane dipeptidase [Candidatus Cybelea sp.]|nr:membrane dipeptidase [Candidatus Cybelea sp.]
MRRAILRRMLLRWDDVASGRADNAHGHMVEIIGWMAVADVAEAHSYFLLTPEPMCCIGCLPGDPRHCIEVFSAVPLRSDGEPLHLRGKLARLTDDPAGWLYQLRDAVTVAPPLPMLGPARLTRRSMIAIGTSLALASCTNGAPAPQAPTSAAPANPEPNTDAARQMLQAVATVDAHSHAGHVFDIKRPVGDVSAPMRDGGMAVICLAIVADTPVTRILPDRRIAAFRNPAPGELYAWSGTEFRRAHEIVREQKLGVIEDAGALKAARSDNPSVVIAAEGADFLDRSLNRLDEAYELYKLRHLQLTHYRVNDLGDIQTEPPVHGGLTDFGAEVIRGCNARGIVVDVAHGTYDLVKRAASVTTKPLVLSHTSLSEKPSARSRLISPDHAMAVAGTGGVIGIWPPVWAFKTIPAYAAGMARMADVVGVDHVALGTDMLGLTTASAFDTYRSLPALAAALLQIGFNAEEIAKLLGGNYARVFDASMA